MPTTPENRDEEENGLEALMCNRQPDTAFELDTSIPFPPQTYRDEMSLLRDQMLLNQRTLGNINPINVTGTAGGNGATGMGVRATSRRIGNTSFRYVEQDFYEQARVRDRQAERAQAHAEELERRALENRKKIKMKDPKNKRPEAEHDSQCFHCSSYFTMDKDKGIQVHDGKVCGDCKEELYFMCEHCEQYELNDNSYHTREGRAICDTCYQDDYFTCERCSEVYSNDDSDSVNDCYYCQSCAETVREELDERSQEVTTFRSWSDQKHPQFISADQGETVKSKRIFSCEIECMYPDDRVLDKVSQDILPREMGVGHDGSISHSGVELQTPMLAGKKGELLINETCDTLNKHKFETDKSCGLHVHLDGADFSDDHQALRRLWMFYIVFEPVFLSFLPKSRQRNQYCRRMQRDYHLSEVINSYDRLSLERLWYRIQTAGEIERVKSNHHHSTRYNGFNFHSLIANGHLEVRYHSGTLNPRKILEWANIHLLAMDLAKKREIDDHYILEADQVFELGEKTDIMFKLLGLSTASKKYFISRQEKFLVRQELPEEALLV